MSRREHERDIIDLCEMVYIERLSRSDIGARTRWSQPKISRLLKEARDKKYVREEFTFGPFPYVSEVEVAIKRHHRLQGVRLVIVGKDEENMSQVLGQQAARIVEAELEDNCSVGISCGNTLSALIDAMGTREIKNLKIRQIGIESDPRTIEQAPSTLCGLLKQKYGPTADVYAMQLPVIHDPSKTEDDAGLREELLRLCKKTTDSVLEEAKQCGIFLLGIGTINFDKENSFTSILRQAGIDKKEIQKHGIVGETNNQPFDSAGHTPPELMEKLKDRVIVLDANEIRGLAARRDRTVIAIAGGPKKVRAIEAALRGKLFNFLITDFITGEALYKSI